MGINYNEFVLDLYNSRTLLGIDDDSGKAVVMNAGSATKPTLYADISGGAQANPITISNGRIRFFTAPGVGVVDVSIVTAAGISVFLKGITPSQHRVNIDPDVVECMIVVPFGVSDNVEVDTGMDLPANVAVLDAFLKVTAIGERRRRGRFSRRLAGCDGGLCLKQHRSGADLRRTPHRGRGRLQRAEALFRCSRRQVDLLYWLGGLGYRGRLYRDSLSALAVRQPCGRGGRPPLPGV
jgi:hypothetical protein